MIGDQGRMSHEESLPFVTPAERMAWKAYAVSILKDSERALPEMVAAQKKILRLLCALEAVCTAGHGGLSYREEIGRYHHALMYLAQLCHSTGVPCPDDGAHFDPEGVCREIIAKGKCPECFIQTALAQADFDALAQQRETHKLLHVQKEKGDAGSLSDNA